MAIYIKPSGAEVEVSDESASAAEALGWEKKEAKKEKASKKGK